MSKWDKLLQRIRSFSNDLRIEEVRKILEAYGYTMKGSSGGSSHFIFRKPGCAPITIPKHEPIKTVYIKMIREIVESEANRS